MPAYAIRPLNDKGRLRRNSPDVHPLVVFAEDVTEAQRKAESDRWCPQRFSAERLLAWGVSELSDE